MPSLLLPALLLAAQAHALDLALAFDGPERQGPSATLSDVGPTARMVALEDGLGDRWVLELAVETDAVGMAVVSGTARLLDVADPKTTRRFEVTAPVGQPVRVPVADPSGEVRLLSLVASAPSLRGVVDCELLVQPTVQDLADAMQELVDEGREPRTGVGEFTVDQGVMTATWVCGW